MGDRTAYQLVVFECPEEQRPGIVEIINYEGLGEEWGAAGGNVTVLELGQSYVDDEKAVGEAQDIASRIIEAAPGATFEIWEDPKYEWLGLLTMYAPDLGRFNAECDADGNPVVGPHELRTVLDAIPDTATAAEVKAEIAKRTGQPWVDRITEYRKKEETANV